MADEKKAWRVLSSVLQQDLEETLNQLAADGFHIFRVDRFEKDRGHDDSHGFWKANIMAFYDVIAFDPVVLSERAGKSMQNMLSNLSASGMTNLDELFSKMGKGG